MMEKLRSRREKSGLSNREMSSLDEPGSADPDKQKKEKKKKKGKVSMYAMVLISNGSVNIWDTNNGLLTLKR